MVLHINIPKQENWNQITPSGLLIEVTHLFLHTERVILLYVWRSYQLFPVEFYLF